MSFIQGLKRKYKNNVALECLWMASLSAFLVLMVCSKCSFLYPFQDGMDINCFFTVGKSLVHGKILYRDIYEHKGIVLYLIYALAYLLSHNTLIGIFFLEVICGAIFLFYTCRIVRLFKENAGTWWLPLFAFLVYSGYSFSYGGQPEELVLPILAWVLYVFLNFVSKSYNEGEYFPLRRVFWMGFWCAVLFWVKYTLTGMFLALVLFMLVLLIRDKKYVYLWKCILCFLAGFVVVTIPVLVYFAANGALEDLWEVYFYNLIFRYNDRNIGMSRLEYSIRKVLLTFWRNKRYSLLIILGVLDCTFRQSKCVNKKTKIGIWMLCLITTAVIFYSKQFNRYWGEVLAVFAILGIGPLLFFLEWAVKKCFLYKSVNKKQYDRSVKMYIHMGLLFLSVILSYYFSMNTYLLAYEKDDMPQYVFKEIIAEDEAEDPAILNYKCLDLGLYTVLDVLPACKYFCDYNINLPELYETQERMIQNGEFDYIVMREPLQIAEELYEEAGKMEFEMEFKSYYQYYYLYRLKK